MIAEGGSLTPSEDKDSTLADARCMRRVENSYL